MENPKRCPKGTRRKYINGSKTEFVCVKDSDIQKVANIRRKEKYQKQNQTVKQKYDIRQVMKTIMKKPEEKTDSFQLTPEEKYPTPIVEEPSNEVIEPTVALTPVESQPVVSPEETRPVIEEEPLPEETIPVIEEESK